MESYCLHSPALTTVPFSLYPNGFLEKTLLNRQVLKFSNIKPYPLTRNLKFLRIRAQASSTKAFSSETAETILNEVDSKDEDLAFVAGATGRVGSRTVRELLKLGFRVRAGVRSAQKAETLVQSVKQMKLDGNNAGEGKQPVERLEIVECDLEKPNQIGPALGNSSIVICCIGASEKEIFDVTGPYRIDYQATKNLIDAATVGKVKHFILLTSLGTNKVGFPAAILNLFWGVLVWKRKAEEALLASGLTYTIVRPGGMERPTDAFKETHNIILSLEDTLFGGLVSNLQVAELIACMAKNPGLSYCKVVEVIAETTAPLTPMEELLAKIPSERANIYSTKESVTAGAPDSLPSQSVTLDKTSIPTEKKLTEEKATKHSLSPYVAYDDLKPPTSPTPTPPVVARKDLNVLDGVSKPDINAQTVTAGLTSIAEGKSAPQIKDYEDLKPPSSPSPTPSGSRTIQTPVEVSVGGTDAAKIEATSVEIGPPRNSPFSSLYLAYDDLKPPTSPSPNAPNHVDGRPQVATSSANSTSLTPLPNETKDEERRDEPKKRPLSPFTMYEDLKPPTSPTPSP